MLKFIEKYLLFIAMLIGILLHKQLFILSPTIPYLLAIMLFISYCKISWKDIRLTKFHYILLGIQYIGSALVYLIFCPFSQTLAQASMICVLASTATSAPVVTGMLGGSVSVVVGYSIMSNISLAFIAPLYLSIVGKTGVSVSFISSFLHIFNKVLPILILPFVLALLLHKVSPMIHRKVRSAQIISFYLWAIALTIVLGNVTDFVITQNRGSFLLEISIAISSLIICLLQFFFGRKIGGMFNRTVAGGQGLGQKSTILAIWLAQTYMNPIASLGPGMYVLWQNLVNSWQIWHKKRMGEKE